MHIKQLERNKYRVWVDLEPDYTGKRKQKSKVFHATSKKDLNVQIDDWVESIAGISSQCKTVSDMCSAVWNQVINNKSPNTVYGYNAAFNRLNTTMGTLDLLK